MRPEASAAIVGAVAGGGIACASQLLTLLRGERRERIAAAQLIFAELTIGYGEAQVAVATGEWPNTVGTARQAAWESFAPKILRGRGVDRVGRLAHAYSALEDIAWLASGGHIDPAGDYTNILTAIEDGLRVTGEMAGLPRAELELRLQAINERDAAFRAELNQPPSDS